MLSKDPVKAHLPSGVRAIEFIQSVCPERTRGLLPGFERSQRRAVLSRDPVKAHLPSGVIATECTRSMCPDRTRALLARLVRSQSCEVLSYDPVKANFPSVSELPSLSRLYALKEHEKLEEKELDVHE